jgi:hypothetical protein
MAWWSLMFVGLLVADTLGWEGEVGFTLKLHSLDSGWPLFGISSEKYFFITNTLSQFS